MKKKLKHKEQNYIPFIASKIIMGILNIWIKITKII
jgi:hypothetical protein